MVSTTPRIFYLLQTAHSALFRAADRRLKDEFGISSTQLAVLFVLRGNDGLPISEIADRLRLRKSSLSGLIDRMTISGLVRRVTSSHDRRVQCIHIEDAGLNIAKEAAGLVQGINARLLAEYSKSEQEVIGRFLFQTAEKADQLLTLTTRESSK